MAALNRIITAPESQARGRHLLEGSLPSGNSNIMQIPSSPTGGIHAHWVSASLVTGYGPEPAGMESPRTMSIQKSPAVRQIQPMGLWGRLEAIRAPTIGKARKGKKSTKPPRALAVPQSLEGCVAGASDKDRTVSVQPPTNMATETAASDQASQGAARVLIPPTPRLCSLIPSGTTPLYRTTVSQALRRPL